LTRTRTESIRRLIRFRLSTIFWIMLAVASFYSGRDWERSRQRVATGGAVVLASGSSHVISFSSKVPRLYVDNPDIVTVTPLSPSAMLVTAKLPGATRITVWENNLAEPVRFNVEVQPIDRPTAFAR